MQIDGGGSNSLQALARNNKRLETAGIAYGVVGGEATNMLHHGCGKEAGTPGHDLVTHMGALLLELVLGVGAR